MGVRPSGAHSEPLPGPGSVDVGNSHLDLRCLPPWLASQAVCMEIHPGPALSCGSPVQRWLWEGQRKGVSHLCLLNSGSSHATHPTTRGSSHFPNHKTAPWFVYYGRKHRASLLKAMMNRENHGQFQEDPAKKKKGERSSSGPPSF